MTLPQVLLLAGLVALVGAIIVLRSFGPRFRVGRLLAATPKVSIAEARALAAAGRPVYVRVEGRIDSDAEFEDGDHRPLVVRRTTLASKRDLGGAGPWTPFDTNLEAVPFVVREGLEEIEVDGGRLAEGLVVVPRESVGRVADLAERAPAELAADAPARLVIEHVSSVEHATVIGQPVQAPSGRLWLTAGLGRPLILTTLVDAEAMRILTEGRVGRPRLAALLLVAAALLLGVGAVWSIVDWLASPATALAASPAPTMGVGSDTRSPGEGPGLVGDPAFAILAVLGIAILSVAATLAYVRTTSRGAAPER